MRRFKSYIAEATGGIPVISDMEKMVLDKAIGTNYTIKDSNRKTTTLVVRAPKDDRKKVKSDIEKRLKAAKVSFKAVRAGGSTGATDIAYKGHTVRITYKPAAGGMSETTLNSTITELAPALAFMARKNSFRNVKEFYAFLSMTSGNNYGVYVNDKDAKAGYEFIETMPTSSKFEEKMENAMAVLDYLVDLNKKTPIQQVYWGYRAKPVGIDSAHKGDLFVKFTNGNMLGVSLKAGGAKTAEPQLNTYVNKFYDDINYSSDKAALQSRVYNKIHASFGLPSDWEDRSKKSNSIDIIEIAREENQKKYDEKYDEMLDIIRDSVVASVNKDTQATLDYIRKQVLKKDENVPLVVVKAVGKKYQMVTDEDALESHIPTVTRVKAYKSDTSKQNWFIDLIGSDKTLTMNMSVRSNKPMPQNKIAQGFNLAIKFNGLAK